MFKKLHLQLTFFLTSVTSLIIIILTVICLLISENGIRKNTLSSFQNERQTVITHLQTQTSFSLMWINQIQERSHFYLYLYDNGIPLYSERLYSAGKRAALVEKVLSYSWAECGIDISHSPSGVLPVYTDFSVTDETGSAYYASAGVISKSTGNDADAKKNALGFILLYPLAGGQRQIMRQRILFFSADLCAILLLFLFSWFFINRMLLPLEENRKKQIQFTASASHELRAPLAVILSAAEALRKAENKKEQEHFFSLIRTEGVRMQHLIADLLLLSHSDSAKMPIHLAQCSPDYLLLEAYEKYETSARAKKIRFTLKLPEESLPSCQADPERIAQLLSILLDNALSYTPDGGTISLSLSQISPAAKKHAPIQNYFLFCTKNNGPSIPDNQKELIFERFYRAESSRTDKKHFGLGLCIAKEIVTAHHGRIWVEDIPGGGVCFCFTLPAAENL